MITVHYTSAQKANGRVYLKAMIPKARQWIADAKDVETKAVSAIAKSAVQHITEEKLDSFIIYQTATGWHADILIRKMPPGVPMIFGSQSQSPSRTKEEAEEKGILILVSMLLLADENKTRKGGKLKPPVFSLYRHAISLVPEFFADLQSILPEGAPLRLMGFLDYEEAIQRIEAALDQFLPRLRETDGKKLDLRLKRMPREELVMLMSVLHRAAMTGVLVYPARTATTASHHEEHATRQ